jgi:signal transduction histidine kinase/ActR/RegA family two-component response regulator
VTPLATIGVLSAVLVWEIERVGSVLLALAIVAAALATGLLIARAVRRQIDELSRHYESLLETADDQSRRAESANLVKDEFLATLSHELRTPLNAVLGWSRLLGSGRLTPEQTTRAIEAIERAGWAQSRLIEDLLDISRIVTGKLKISARPALIQPLVESSVDALRPAADAKHIALEVTLDPAIGPIEVDPDRLRQVVWNLVSNAVKFTPPGGRASVSLTTEGDQMRLDVTDTGIGLTPDIASHLFERFHQGDSSSTREYGGLGLGLGIVRHIVELHGGTVQARSAGADHGSTFTVCIPMKPASGWQPASVGQPGEATPMLDGVTVLAVDDDPHALEFVRSTLEQYGALVVTAGSAREARERYTRQRPDVVVSDLVMPDVDGLELIREIRALDQTAGRLTPAAALTALARNDDRRRALNAGYQMHVSKPVDPQELATIVNRLARHERRS